MKTTIALSLTRLGVSIAIVLGLVMAVVQIVQDYSDEVQRNEALIRDVLKIASVGATQAAVQVSPERSADVVQSFLVYDFIVSARIVDDRGGTLAQVSREPNASIEDPLTRLFTDPYVDYEIALTVPETKPRVGVLDVTVHSTTILREFYDRTARLIIVEVLRNLLLAAILLWTFHSVLTRPISALIQRLDAVDPRNPKPFDAPERIAKAHNDLTVLTDSANSILSASREYLNDLAETQRRAEIATSQLRHSEKLSAIGQLVGGVAHDFNNILAILMGGLELLDERSLNPQARAMLDAMRRATDKGATLTQQLLSYSRRHPLDPKPIDASAILDDMTQLLARALGEQYTLRCMTQEGLWTCLVDRQQLETVLLNLALNARDAMPDGGRLTIDTFNAHLDETYCAQEDDVAPGEYVCFAVLDEGTGMSSAVIDSAFEPYFTTKPAGQGSGLGLSMAYGFAKQSKGHIKIQSVPGNGSTISLYLPRSTGYELPVAGDPTAAVAYDGADLSGRCLLVAEDDPLVLKILEAHLEELEIETVIGPSAEAALSLFHATQRLDGALLDIVLPGTMNGPALAEVLVRERPDFPIAFMSGYSETAIVRHAWLDEGFVFLPKPFSRERLIAVLQQLFPSGGSKHSA